MDTEMMDGTSLAASILDDPASATYVRMKQNRCRTVGIESRHVALAESSSTADVVATVDALSQDATVDGIQGAGG